MSRQYSRIVCSRIREMWFGFAALALFGCAQPALAQGCSSPANSIVAENCLTGNPKSEWDITGAGSSSIQGFATDISVNRGQTIQFKIRSTSATAYRLDIYRSGYYNGNGARKVATVNPSVSLPQSQPNCLTSAATGLIDCGNWAVSASWAVPAGAVSGVYFAKVVATAGITGSSHIFFIVRDDNGGSDMLYQVSDSTWQAYNNYGGNSLYTGSPAGRAYKVSYNRPFNTRAVDNGQDWYFANEYPMVRFLEANGYNVSYFTDVDSDRRGAEILEHKIFLSVGHDEYWSGGQRANVEAAREQGVHLAFFSGNEVFWKTRWENSIDSSGAPYRTLVCYKETHDAAKIDPNPAWTGTWRDPRFSPPSDGGNPENALTGTMFMVNFGAEPITVSEAEGKMRFWRNTTFASMAPGATASTAAGFVGYESDDAPNDAFAPAGLIRLSTHSFFTGQYLVDYGSFYGGGTSTHSLVMYRRPSGAIVFGAGTIRWSWALDSNHDIGGPAVDVRLRQATVNLFADMDVQPATLISGLVPATKSTDATPPVTTITWPPPSTALSQGTPVTVSGTASDVGGRVAAVEVSTDGGATWKSATGTTNWTFNWTPSVASPVTIKTRGIDDTGNFESPSAGSAVTVGGRVCPCTIWSPSAIPETVTENDSNAVELGVKFRTSVSGTITALRFYKGPQNTGTHTGRLWSSTGTQLGSVTFTGETASGWQQMNFASPIPVTAGTTYVASYFAPNGFYSATLNGLSSAVDSAPLRALSNGESGGNGVYLYGASGFPNATWGSSNYYVDVVFAPANTDTTAPIISGVGAAPAATSAVITWTTDEDSNSTVNFGTSSGALNQSASNAAMVKNHSVTLTNLTPGAYFYRVTSADAASNSASNPVAPGTLSFTIVDNTAPSISGVSATPGSTAATIVWNTDEPSTTVVNYGTSPATLNLTSSNLTLTLAHSATLTGLTQGVTYYFRVTSADASNNSATSPASPAAPGSFTTVAPVPAVISGLRSAPTASGTAIITWTTDKASHSRVDYGTSPAALNQSVTDAAMVTAHSVPLSGLTAGATYYMRVTSTEAGGASATFPLAANPPAMFVAKPPLSVWPANPTPGTIDSGDSNAREVGLKFRSDSGGLVTGVRFYKAAANTGVHTGNLWTSAGALLGTLTFAGETASGWQTAYFAEPVPVDPNTTYVVSYHAPVGRYSQNAGAFTSVGVDSLPLRALANGTDGPNGVFVQSASSAFPASSGAGANYWVDVVFADTMAPTVSNVSAAAGVTTATVTWTTNEASTTRVDYGTSAASLNLNASNATLLAAHSQALNGLTTGTTYYYRVTSIDGSGNSVTFPATGDAPLTFTPQDTAAPVITAVNASPGGTSATITWTTDEASTTVVNYGSSQASLDQTVANASMVTAHNISIPGLTAGITYYFRVTSVDAFANSATSPNPPNAPASFTTVTSPPPTISAVVATPGLDGAARIAWTTNQASNSQVQYGTSPDALNQTVTDPAQVTAHVVNLTGLTYGATYYFRVASTNAANATALFPAVPAAPSTFVENAISLFPVTAVPGTAANTTDTAAVVLGVKFRSDVAGTITAIRFYKGSGNTGTHTGRIFSSTGTSLANVTFANETATGWQQQNLTTPLAIAANTTYVVSYRAPVGRYAINSNYFATTLDRGPLHAPSSATAGGSGNGVYRYGSATVFPNQSWQSANYWVDVVFIPNP